MYSVHSLHECQDHRTVLIEQVVTALQLDFSVQIWEGATHLEALRKKMWQ